MPLGELANPTFPVLHLEISSGFQLGISWPAEILVASRECYVEPPSISYLQALLENMLSIIIV